MEQLELKMSMQAVLNTLTSREAFVLKALYGIGCPDHTYRETANLLNLSHGQVRQIEANALRKCRHSSRSDKLIN